VRRGLISRSPAELPDAVLEARLGRVRAAMIAAGLDALLIYTNNTRTAGVSWLTGFVPYWSEALLVVSRERDPVLVVALTYRVKSWIERTSRAADVIHTPRIGLEAARLIAATRAAATIGIADLDGLGAGVVDDLRAGGPDLSVRDASAMFAQLRAPADPAEIALAARAGTIAQEALVQAALRSGKLGEIIAAVEREARERSAEEIYVAAAPDLGRDCRLRRIEGEFALGQRFALRATVAYKGTWARVMRTLDRDGGEATSDAAAARFAAAVAGLPNADGFAPAPSWLVEGCRIAQPLEALLGSRVTTPVALAPGALVSVQATFNVEGKPVSLGAPALLGHAGEPASLLVQPC
jgi:Creatinase/Prolidase N-terminal domain